MSNLDFSHQVQNLVQHDISYKMSNLNLTQSDLADLAELAQSELAELAKSKLAELALLDLQKNQLVDQIKEKKWQHAYYKAVAKYNNKPFNFIVNFHIYENDKITHLLQRLVLDGPCYKIVSYTPVDNTKPYNNRPINYDCIFTPSNNNIMHGFLRNPRPIVRQLTENKWLTTFQNATVINGNKPFVKLVNIHYDHRHNMITIHYMKRFEIGGKCFKVVSYKPINLSLPFQARSTIIDGVFSP